MFRPHDETLWDIDHVLKRIAQMPPLPNPWEKYGAAVLDLTAHHKTAAYSAATSTASRKLSEITYPVHVENQGLKRLCDMLDAYFTILTCPSAEAQVAEHVVTMAGDWPVQHQVRRFVAHSLETRVLMLA